MASFSRKWALEEELEAMHSDAEEGRVWCFGARNGLFPVLAVVQGNERAGGQIQIRIGAELARYMYSRSTAL